MENNSQGENGEKNTFKLILLAKIIKCFSIFITVDLLLRYLFLPRKQVCRLSFDLFIFYYKDIHLSSISSYLVLQIQLLLVLPSINLRNSHKYIWKKIPSTSYALINCFVNPSFIWMYRSNVFFLLIRLLFWKQLIVLNVNR